MAHIILHPECLAQEGLGGHCAKGKEGTPDDNVDPGGEEPEGTVGQAENEHARKEGRAEPEIFRTA